VGVTLLAPEFAPRPCCLPSKGRDGGNDDFEGATDWTGAATMAVAAAATLPDSASAATDSWLASERGERYPRHITPRTDTRVSELALVWQSEGSFTVVVFPTPRGSPPPPPPPAA